MSCVRTVWEGDRMCTDGIHSPLRAEVLMKAVRFYPTPVRPFTFHHSETFLFSFLWISPALCVIFSSTDSPTVPCVLQVYLLFYIQKYKLLLRHLYVSFLCFIVNVFSQLLGLFNLYFFTEASEIQSSCFLSFLCNYSGLLHKPLSSPLQLRLHSRKLQSVWREKIKTTT